ncbi:glycine--tRNA ligase subunit beta, partial [Oleiphilus sp. HI0066]
MSSKDFLIELGTEELPPKALKKLSDAFSQGILSGLDEAGISYKDHKSYAAPRRLALEISDLALQQADKEIEKRGPSKKAAFDDAGEPSRALLGFTKSLGIEPSDLEEMETPKGTWLIYRSTESGKATKDLISDIVAQSLAKLPIPKRMRWGAKKEEFVRPVQWVVMLLGEEVVSGETMGITHGNMSRGHRFMSTGEIQINTPSEYESKLKTEGKVMVNYEERKALIKSGVEKIALTVNGIAIIDDDLLDEVNSL